MAVSPFDPGPPRRRRSSGARRVLAVGALVSIGLAAYIGAWERRGLIDELHALAAERIELLDSTMRLSLQSLYSLRSLNAATAGIEPAEFARFAHDVRARHPELQALEWAPRVDDAERAAFESRVRASGGPGGVDNGFRITELAPDGALVAAARRPAYFPVQLIEPLTSNEAAHGLDLARDPRRGAALERARQSRLPIATAPLRLAQEHGDQTGFLVFLPLYRPGLASAAIGEPSGELDGFALAVFRFGDLIQHAMRGLDSRRIAFSIDDVTEQPARRVYGERPDPGPTGGIGAAAGAAEASPLPAWLPSAAWHETLDVAGRQWRLDFVPDRNFVFDHLPWQTLTTLFSGLIITALLATMVELMARRGAALAQANEALQREAVRREQAAQSAIDASASKTTFLASMSHEIRTPMNAVLGYAQLLRRDPRLDSAQRDAVNAIVASGSHLMSQINEVLDFSKIESGRIDLNRSDFDLNAMLVDLERMFRPRCAEKHLTLRIEPVAAQASYVHGDLVKLQQILINLLGNAVRFTQVGGVTVRAEAYVSGVHRFDVVDTGPGVSEAERERIFEPFYQSQGALPQGGTGLGLSIARRQALAMGGTLELLRGEVGSNFVLTVPLERAHDGDGTARALALSESAAGVELADGEALSAWVIDDVQANRDVLVRLLLAAGCDARASDDTAAVVRSLHDQPTDVVFLDMRMPGIDGLTALAPLRAASPSVRVIAYTAAAFEQDRQRFLHAGCDAVVSKPIDVGRLFATLAEVSGRRFVPSATVTRDGTAGDQSVDTVDAFDAGDTPPSREPDYALLRVPAELMQQMLTAADLHSATVLKSCLEQLRALGPEQALLARHLRYWLRSYDMTAVSRLLMRVTEAPAEMDREQAP